MKINRQSFLIVISLLMSLSLVGCEDDISLPTNHVESSSKILESSKAINCNSLIETTSSDTEDELASFDESSDTSESESEMGQDSPTSSEQLPTETIVDHDEDYRDLDRYLFKTLDKQDFGYLERISNENGYQITCLKIGTVDAEKVRLTVEQYLEKNKIEGLNIEYIPARRSYHELETIAADIRAFCDKNKLEMANVFLNIENVVIQMHEDYPELHEYLENHPDKDCFIIQVITVPDPLV